MGQHPGRHGAAHRLDPLCWSVQVSQCFGIERPATWPGCSVRRFAAQGPVAPGRLLQAVVAFWAGLLTRPSPWQGSQSSPGSPAPPLSTTLRQGLWMLSPRSLIHHRAAARTPATSSTRWIGMVGVGHLQGPCAPEAADPAWHLAGCAWFSPVHFLHSLASGEASVCRPVCCAFLFRGERHRDRPRRSVCQGERISPSRGCRWE